jgi:hypothetical protein
MLGIIDKNKKAYSPKIFLAKPNRTIIAKLKEAYDITTSRKYGGIHEVSFKIPYTVVRHHQTIKNDHVDILHGHYLLKVDNEWYVINKPKRTASDGKEILEVTAYYLPYELRNKNIVKYDGVKNAQEVMDDCLEGTYWSVGYVDADFVTTFRTFKDVANITVLDFLNQISTTFDGVLYFDTENKLVSMFKEQNLGVDKGLTIKYGKYLRSINEEPNFDEVCTRLYAYGKDNISLHGTLSTGTGFVEDFSYYMYPYEEEVPDIFPNSIPNISPDSYRVIKHSNYMTDALCHALIKYAKLIELKDTEFKSFLETKTAKQVELTALKNELTTLGTELAIIKDNLTAYQATHNNITDATLVKERDDKQSEIEIKTLQIQSKEDEIAVVDSQLTTVVTLLAKENNFSEEQILELDSYIFEKRWSDENFTDKHELLTRAKRELKKLSQPIIQYSVDIVDFLKVVECQRDWDKLGIGDVITIRYDYLGIDIQAKLIGINHNHSDNKITLDIANAKDIKSGFSKISDLMQRATTTSTLLEISKFKWDIAEEANSKVEQIIQGKIDANKNAVVAGVNENYSLDRTGLTLKDPNDPMNFLRGLHNILAFTNDGGNTYKHAITPTGIVGEYIYGKIITGVNLIIGDEDGTLQILGNKAVITDDNDNIVMRWGLYETLAEHGADRYGLKLYRDNNTITIDRDFGFKIQKKKSSLWEDTVWLDLNGRIWLEDITAKRITIINGAGDEIINTDTSTMNIGKFISIIADGKLTTIEKLQIRSEWLTIQAEKIRIEQQADAYASIDRDSQIHTNKAPYLSAFNALKDYIEPLLSKMEETTEVDRDVFNSKFKNYYDQAIKLINDITDALRYSSLQLGQNYNNCIIDAVNGFTALRSDGIVRTMMNATDGIKIQRKVDGVWYDKLYADTFGNLHAEDLIAKRLVLYNDDGQLVLDANTKLFDLSAFNEILGQLKPENIVAKSIIANEGFISDLTVNRLRTTDGDDNPLDLNYIDIAGKTANWITGKRTTQTQAIDSKGRLLYFTDDTKTKMTVTFTEYPVMIWGYSKVTKMEMGFDSNDPNVVPYIRMGAGSGNGDRAKAFIRKLSTSWEVEYISEATGNNRKLSLGNADIDLSCDTTGSVKITENGRMELTHKSGSYIKLEANGDVLIHSTKDCNITSVGKINLN